MVPIVLTAATVVLIYLLGWELYGRRSGLIVALVFPAFPAVFRIGATAMTDLPAVFFSTLAMLLVVRLSRKPTVPLACAAGVAIGSGLLTKYTVALILPVLAGYAALSGMVRKHVTLLLVVCGVGLGMFAVWLAYAARTDILGVQARQLTFYAGIVTTTGRGRYLLAEHLLTHLPSALGVYTIPLIVLGGWRLMRERATADLLVLLWIGVVSFLLLITLPDYRYFMIAFPALALAAARGLDGAGTMGARAVLLAWLCCAGALYVYYSGF